MPVLGTFNQSLGALGRSGYLTALGEAAGLIATHIPFLNLCPSEGSRTGLLGALWTYMSLLRSTRPRELANTAARGERAFLASSSVDSSANARESGGPQHKHRHHPHHEQDRQKYD